MQGGFEPSESAPNRYLGMEVGNGVGGRSRLGEALLDLLAHLFGAPCSGAGGIQLEIDVDILEESGVVFLLEMNEGEKLIDARDIGSEGASLSGTGLRFREVAFANLELSDFVETHPGAGTELDALAKMLLAFDGLPLVDEERTDSNLRGTVLAVADLERLTETVHGIGGMLQFQIGDACFVFRFVAARRLLQCFLEKTQGGRWIILRVECLAAGSERFARRLGEREFVGRNVGAGGGRRMLFRNRPEIKGNS